MIAISTLAAGVGAGAIIDLRTRRVPNELTGGLAAVCAFAALMVKLVTKGDADLRWFRVQTFLLGIGAALYIVPYILGVQVTEIGSDFSNQLAAALVSSQNPTVALALCYLSGFLVGLLGVVAVIYNVRQTSVSRAKSTPSTEERER